MRLLLESRANCNIKDKQERRPIHWASYMGYTEVVEELLKYGADINCLDREVIVFKAKILNSIYLTCCNACLNAQHYTPLLAACASGKSEEVIERLVDLGADVNACTINGSGLIHVACLNGHEHLVKYLLLGGNKTTASALLEMKLNERGYHPLHYAAGCKRGSFCVELLTSILSNVHVGESCVDLVSCVDGKTPMHIAAMHGLTTNAQILQANGIIS